MPPEPNPWELYKWLDSQGGRTESDLLRDEWGVYVHMADGQGGVEKVYYGEITN